MLKTNETTIVNISILFRLCSKGKFEKAAAIAVFSNDIPSAINILSAGANESLKSNSEKGMVWSCKKWFILCVI